MQTYPQYTRFNSYHGPKRQLLGNQSGNVPPAWRTAAGAPAAAQLKRPLAAGSTSGSQGVGSKILLSRLPADVTENEVEVSTTRTQRLWLMDEDEHIY